MAYPGDEDEYDPEMEQAWEEEEQLALADEDEDLPWLEADEYEEEGGFDARLLWIGVFGLLVVGLILSAGWWFLRETPDAELVADGSTIEAPDGPYKERPDDPGGSEVEGTGDQSFEMAEGETTRGRIADDASEARPSIDREQGTEDAAPASDDGAVWVQIAALGNRAAAEAEWSRASGQYGVLSGKRHRILEGEASGTPVFRVQVAHGDRASADATCRAIRNAGGACYVR